MSGPACPRRCRSTRPVPGRTGRAVATRRRPRQAHHRGCGKACGRTWGQAGHSRPRPRTAPASPVHAQTGPEARTPAKSTFPDARQAVSPGSTHRTEGQAKRTLCEQRGHARTRAEPPFGVGWCAVGKRVLDEPMVRSVRIQRPQAVIAANPELQEREALKGLALAVSMADALMQCGVPDLTARVAAELGALTLKIAYERWSDMTDGEEFSEVARRTLSELQAASALC